MLVDASPNAQTLKKRERRRLSSGSRKRTSNVVSPQPFQFGMSMRTMFGNGRERTKNEERALVNGSPVTDVTLVDNTDDDASTSITARMLSRQDIATSDQHNVQRRGAVLFRCHFIGSHLHIRGGAHATIAHCEVTGSMGCAVYISGVGTCPDMRFNTLDWVSFALGHSCE